jgi:hypothetical protein
MRRPAKALSYLVAGALLAGSAPSFAAIFGGGGSSKTDCLSVFSTDVNYPPSKPKQIRCADGDVACDKDGIVNGSCSFEVGVCANSTVDPRCTLNGVESIAVDHALDNGDSKFDTDFQALQTRIASQIDPPATTADDCTTPTTIRVPLQGPLPGGVCKATKKIVKLTTLSTFVSGKQYKDVDKLLLSCVPAPSGCDPQVLFPDGTYQRIQRQIFNQSCALSGCHDSQTTAGGMLLETAGSYSNLVDVVPFTPAAQALGWKRVDAANASAETSFIIHKLTGDLGPGMGDRMPRGKPKLPQYLIDIVQLWIEAGAPQAGWVPGTDQ